jgi:hypothetical protein
MLGHLNSIHDAQDSAQSFIGQIAWPHNDHLRNNAPRAVLDCETNRFTRRVFGPEQVSYCAARNAELLSPISS